MGSVVRKPVSRSPRTLGQRLRGLGARWTLFWLGVVVVGSYSLYFFRTGTLRWRRPGDGQRLLALHVRNAERFARVAAGARGALIKLGQFLSARADIIPAEVVRVLAVLQDSVPQAPFAEVEQLIARELGKPALQVFASLDPVAIGAASLGQVHAGTLSDGLRVAVKVQYADIEAILERDFGFLHFVLERLQRFSPQFQFLPLFREFRRAVMEEIDYVQEARNGARVREELQGLAWVRIPQVLTDYSSRRVLTMTFLEGYRITRVDEMERLGLEPEAVMARVVEVYCEQIFVKGFFQSDPHPGNLFFDRGANGEVVVGLVDFGQAKAVPPEVHQAVMAGVASLLASDAPGVARALVALGLVAPSATDRLSEEVTKLASRWAPALWQGALVGGDGPVDLATMKAEFSKLLEDTGGVTVPSELVLYGRTLSLLQGLCARVAPRMRFLPSLVPYVARAIMGLRRTKGRLEATSSGRETPGG